MPRKIWLNVPCHSGKMHVPTISSIWNDIAATAGRDDAMALRTECGNALIGDARSLMVEKFLEDGGGPDDVFIFLDDDVSWPPGALYRLIDAPVDFRVGLYPQRKDPPAFVAHTWPDRPDINHDAETGLIEAARVPLGFAAFSRSMLEAMRKHYDGLDFYCADAKRARVCSLFSEYWLHDQPIGFDGETASMKLGEDFAFCQRWLDMGGKVWVLPEIEMGHTGYKTFTGSIGEHLRARAQPTPERVTPPQ